MQLFSLIFVTSGNVLIDKLHLFHYSITCQLYVQYRQYLKGILELHPASEPLPLRSEFSQYVHYLSDIVTTSNQALKKFCTAVDSMHLMMTSIPLIVFLSHCMIENATNNLTKFCIALGTMDVLIAKQIYSCFFISGCSYVSLIAS